VQVVIRNPRARNWAEDDWFQKKVFDWMKHPCGVGPEVPTRMRRWRRKAAKSGRGSELPVQQTRAARRYDSQGEKWLRDAMELLGP